jgi:gamma-glutamylcyclotransferase (GGCT)/AIG2-like uncharacterized protein YtfP
MGHMSHADTFLLFVYGTLKRGGVRHGPLAKQRFLGTVRTAPGYALWDLGAYPGLTPSDDGARVGGELYEVERSLLGLLDAVEGAPQLFRLGPIELEGNSSPAWAYFHQLPTAGRDRIEGGQWDTARPRPPETGWPPTEGAQA